MTERVLVVPTQALRDAGLFQGFSDRVEHYLAHLLQPHWLRYLPRPDAETDPEFKQLIPYVVLRYQGQVFHYQRGGGGEARLHAKRSIGLGGHICSDDGQADADAYRVGLWRELREEVDLGELLREQCLGLINDDATPVGQVHLGIVHLLDLASPTVRSREAALLGGGFAPLERLRAEVDAFESWSRFLLDGPWLTSHD